MYEPPLMGHTLVTYCWGGKSQIKRGLKTCLKVALSTRQESLHDAVLDLRSNIAYTNWNLKSICSKINFIGYFFPCQTPRMCSAVPTYRKNRFSICVQ